MKSFAKFIITSLVAMFAVAAFAQSYPVANPTYIPNADLGVTVFSAPSNSYVMNTSGIGTVTLRVSGTCTSLAATVQGSNDQGTNYTAINLYPIATGTTPPTAVASIAAVGFWKINSVGFNRVRVNISALTATCSFEFLGAPGGFNGTQF